jgi:DNA replication protein DnaC
VVLVGSPGVGKTHIAVALGVEAVRARKPARFVDCQRLVADLERAAEKGALERRMRFFAHLSLLAVDEAVCLDVGKEGADLLFQLVPGLCERRSTTAATNVGIGSWAKVFGDPVVASAIADRLCHHCTVIRITGRSYRTKDLPAEDRAAGQGGADSGDRS